MRQMKRVCSALLILTLILSIFTVSASAASDLWTTGSVYLRTGPGLNYSYITVLSSGTGMTLKAYAYDSRDVLWYKVSVNNYTGWVSSINVSQVKGGSAAIGSVRLTGEENLRQYPDKQAHALGTVPKNTKVSYYDVSTDNRGVDWYLIHYNGTTGWISSKYTTKSSGSSSSSSGKTTYVSASKGKSNIRTGPGLSYDIIRTFPEGAVAQYAGNSSTDNRGVKWYKITYKGTTGWVSSRYTSKYSK